MDWTRSETLALAGPACSTCHGLGLRAVRGNVLQPCHCVFRSIFRACLGRFRECVTTERYLSRVTLDAVPGKDHQGTWSRKQEEFIADFCLVSRRALEEDEYLVFRYHFLLGADWHLCCQRLHVDRGTFFHSVYRIQEKLGKVYRELQPYPLYPIAEYFYGPSKGSTSCLTSKGTVVPIRPPVKQLTTGPPKEKVA
jgi:hypothetical protein